MKYVSIIVCHYGKIDDHGETSAGDNPPKRSDLLRGCLKSLKENTDYPAEIIVMDNGGSPDDTDFLVSQVREGNINQLVRYKDNMNFAFAWNQGVKLATGDYIALICNDIEFLPKWLSSCVSLLEKYGTDKIATPFITYDKRRMTTVKEDGARFNPRSGSNCMVLTKETFYRVGEFEHHRIGGTIWYNKLYAMGIPTMAPPEDLAIDRGFRHGLNFSIPIKVKKTLLDKSEVDFTSKMQ